MERVTNNKTYRCAHVDDNLPNLVKLYKCFHTRLSLMMFFEKLVKKKKKNNEVKLPHQKAHTNEKTITLINTKKETQPHTKTSKQKDNKNKR